MLDLSLRVLQAHGVPLLGAFVIGVLPFVLFNGWLLSGLTEGIPQAGPYITRLTEDMANSLLANSDRPFPRFFFCYNPYAPKANWRELPTLGFTHPGSGEKMRFEAPLPEDLAELLSLLLPSIGHGVPG